MRYHDAKFFSPAFVPRPFSHDVRRGLRDPVGNVAIQTAAGEPIYSHVHSVPTFAMRFGLDASTSVTFNGERYLLCYLRHSFGVAHPPRLELTARARQYSCFAMLIGKLGSADTLDAEYGIILENQDELRIPLLLETLPAPQEFRDAVASLSPEQQRFARAYRAMQLEGSAFAVCLIHIVPQLEVVLGLPDGSLTKELELTREVLEMFTTYQIPPDLLSYTGPAASSTDEKLRAVKGHASKLRKMINDIKSDELAQAKQQAEMEAAAAKKQADAEAAARKKGEEEAAARRKKSQSNETELYELLGVEQDATGADIKRAYRKQVRACHPDKPPEKGGDEAKFKKITYAFEVLRNEEKREIYDAYGEEGLESGGGGAGCGVGPLKPEALSGNLLAASCSISLTCVECAGGHLFGVLRRRRRYGNTPGGIPIPGHVTHAARLHSCTRPLLKYSCFEGEDI